MEENGVWRTVGGRRIFIKEGQDLASAMKESGKFGKKEENLSKELQDIQEKTIKDYEEEIFDIFNLEQYSADDIKRSKVFDDDINDKINKVAFNKNYEITTQEVKQIKDNIYKEYEKRRNELLKKDKEPSIVEKNENKLSQLENEAKTLKNDYENLGNKLKEYSKYAVPTDKEDKEKRAKYYEYRKQYSQKQEEYNNKLNEILKEKNSGNEKLSKEITKLNGYGEATNRNITSTTYERALKRTQRDVEKWLGIK